MSWYWYVPFCDTEATPQRVIVSRDWSVKFGGLGLPYSPVQFGLRLARKASTPSLKSFEV
jgi:hypothetical protein